MDLRHKNLTVQSLRDIHRFIIQRKLAYQPFIFTDTLEVGEGLKFHDGETSAGNVYWENADPRVRDLLVTEPIRFRDANQQLRIIYEHFLDTLVVQLGGDISQLTFAEIGCNTGYLLHGLAIRGAKRCLGYDFTNNVEVFAWFDKVLGISNEFYFAEWDSLTHCLRYAELPEVDVILSVAVTCHLADPVQHLAYLCDHARKAVFLWAPVNDQSDLTISFGSPSKYPNALDWPLSFDNDVRLSIPLVRLCMTQSGFEDIFEVQPPVLPQRWREWYFFQRGYVAFRTKPIKTALGGGKRVRTLPSDVDSGGLPRKFRFWKQSRNGH
jgi:SAM-dependent methyltransferase